ncbi:MAG: hypothetical protein NXH97_23450 [Rhodobacteraceae bacterium]|nr:hypothetical protein [Paracoccaceae bacterium]
MYRSNSLTVAALGVALAAPGPVLAEQVTLRFQLVTQDVETTSYGSPVEGGNSLEIAKAVGTAVFEDGRIAQKIFTYNADNGTLAGYSKYVFENGDALNPKFSASWSAKGVDGDYELISGTGAYEGATGSGRFDSVSADWTGATLFDGSFTLEIPDS